MREFARILAFFISIYYYLVIIRIIVQWIRLPGTEQTGGPFIDLLGKLVDPFLGFFKRLIPLKARRIDFSPLFALIALSIVQRILQRYAITGNLTLGYALALILQSLWWSAGAYAIGFLGVLLAIRLYLCYNRNPQSIQYIAMLDGWLSGMYDFILKKIFRGKETSTRKIVTTALISVIACFVIISIIINVLTNLLSSLKF
ncbi:MAG: YggT family protein [Sphaerochaetaceae bacterium]|jgi:YggT family protein|nr:YggT family protein [Sphaerochaetaceae bacterium]NLO60042.1 YggT family protein [Spirochaetales bacterium]MDD2404824.1 YggT family protein [Sphaerochaetaceae bacterium]MDD3671236.1 YggT family protein [Sphaerochaetaceae bacterium]MDD4258488.1 YggT family protein [Sphaerochaetaceae bacterium]